jgi:hypothetical protein
MRALKWVIKYAFTSILDSEIHVSMSEREKVAEFVHLLRGAFAIHDRYFMYLGQGVR